jgi:hypothetical protein
MLWQRLIQRNNADGAHDAATHPQLQPTNVISPYLGSRTEKSEKEHMLLYIKASFLDVMGFVPV